MPNPAVFARCHGNDNSRLSTSCDALLRSDDSYDLEVYRGAPGFGNLPESGGCTDTPATPSQFRILFFFFKVHLNSFYVQRFGLSS